MSLDNGLLTADAVDEDIGEGDVSGPVLGGAMLGTAAETARRYLPQAMVHYEGDADRVRGNSMEPEMREGDRLLVKCR